MGPELLEIQPRDLNFTFEVKKQSTCSVQLVNKSDEYIAFKIKTTSPKRYCVRPNTGVILPRSKCEFTVTMQAQRAAPPDMQLKDKFLIQSTIVPFGSADEDILPNYFLKESGRHIEENKLRVVLLSPSHSPVSQTTNGASKPELANEAPVFKENPALKETPALNETTPLKETPALKETSTLKETPALEETTPLKEAPLLKETTMSRDQTSQAKDVEDLKSKVKNLESKLNEADKTIATLREEIMLVSRGKDKLQQDIVLLKGNHAGRVRIGFPLLFVVFMALVGMAIGYLLHQ